MPWWGVGIALGLNYNRDVTKLEGERLTRAYDGGAESGGAQPRRLARRGRVGRGPRHAVLARSKRRPECAQRAVPRGDAPDLPPVSRRPRGRHRIRRRRDEPASMAVVVPRRDARARHAGTGGVLEAVLRRHPNHPGANHYYVHAVEASPTPERALASAARLETLVPGAGHLVHMPTHIYIHTGHIGRVAELNAKAAAGRRALHRGRKTRGRCTRSCTTATTSTSSWSATS